MLANKGFQGGLKGLMFAYCLSTLLKGELAVREQIIAHYSPSFHYRGWFSVLKIVNLGGKCANMQKTTRGGLLKKIISPNSERRDNEQ